MRISDWSSDVCSSDLASSREGTGGSRMTTTSRRPRLAVVIGTVCFLAFLALLFYGVRQSGRGDREALPSPLIDRPAPDFTLPLLHEPGRLVTTKDLLGTPYVLNVWGRWCPECRVEHPVLSRFALTKRVRVLGYNLKDGSEEHTSELQSRMRNSSPCFCLKKQS